MVTLQAPTKSRSREQAREIVSVLPPSLTGADVLLDCRGIAIATPSFTDEVLKQILMERGARRLTVVHAPRRFTELLQRAAARLSVDERLEIVSRPDSGTAASA